MTNNSNEVYIEFLNKEKGYQKDVKHFKSYEQAVNWARKNFDKFSPDMIKYKMAGGGGIGGGVGNNDNNMQFLKVFQQYGFINSDYGADNSYENKNKDIIVFSPKSDTIGMGWLSLQLSNNIEQRIFLKPFTTSALIDLFNKYGLLQTVNKGELSYTLYGKGGGVGGGVGSDDSILNLFKKNKINKNSKEAYAEWENEVIEVIEYNENINRSQAQEIVDAKEFEMAHSWSNNKPAFNTAQVILGKKLVSSGRSNPFDYKGKTDKIREITKEMREIAREINPTKREVRREVRMELP
jgi:hypothetical protein